MEGINEERKVRQSVVSTVNNVIFSYDLWCLDILSENARRIKSEDFDNLLASIIEKLEHTLVVPYTVKVDPDTNRITLVPKESGIFMPNDVNKNFIYMKPSIMFGDELRFLIKNYKALCYATAPSSVNFNAENFVTDACNYFFVMKDNLIDDERVLRNIFGNAIKTFNNTKEGLEKYLNFFIDDDYDVEMFLISDYFWVDMILFDVIEENNMMNDPRINRMYNKGKAILYTPENKDIYDKFKEAFDKDNGNNPISSFSLTKLWDRK